MTTPDTLTGHPLADRIKTLLALHDALRAAGVDYGRASVGAARGAVHIELHDADTIHLDADDDPGPAAGSPLRHEKYRHSRVFRIERDGREITIFASWSGLLGGKP